jgi:hypothetical protein
LPESQWLRLLVYTELAAGTPAQEQVQALLDKGFDLELSPDQRYAEIIASAEDLDDLHLLGYATVVVRDLLED